MIGKKQSEKECKLKNFYAVYNNVLFCKCSAFFRNFFLSLLPLVLCEEHRNESSVRKIGRLYKIYDDVSKTINECKNVINSITIISDFVERRKRERKFLIYSSACALICGTILKIIEFLLFLEAKCVLIKTLQLDPPSVNKFPRRL